MKASCQDFDHIAVITMSGEFTADDQDAFTRVLGDRVGKATRHIVIDCHSLEFVDGKGLEALLDLQERLGAAGGQMRLVRPDDTIRTILRLTRLELALEAHDTLEDAVRSLR
jgi:anti-sigma B factor antagonist